jgi:hypothetical protein
MKHIISASRRTDIPAFFIDWFIKRLEQGSVLVKNPYSGKVSEVSLRPEAVHSVVLWSKDFRPLLRRIEEVERRAPNLFFHFTITGVPKTLEQHTPEATDAARDFKFISQRYSRSHIVWRFDPVVVTDRLPFEAYEDSFARLAGMLKAQTTECYFSFMEPYKKVLRNFEKYASHRLIELSVEKKQEYAKRLSAIARKNGMKLIACCNEYLVDGEIEKARCIDAGRQAALFKDMDLSAKSAPTREGCGCARAIDIGAYDTCAHGCLYCYANSDKEKAKRFLNVFDPEQRGLGFDMEKTERELF